MAEKISGELHISNDVLSDIVGNAAMECYGVVGMANSSTAGGISKIIPTSKLRRGVSVKPTENGVQVELDVIIEYGTSIQTVSQNLTDQVTFALSEYAKVPVCDVEVRVRDVKVRK